MTNSTTHAKQSATVLRRNKKKWWCDELEKLVWLGLSDQFTPTEICEANEISLEQFFHWRERYIFGGRAEIASRTSQNEHKLGVKVESLQDHIKELKIQIESLRGTAFTSDDRTHAPTIDEEIPDFV